MTSRSRSGCRGWPPAATEHAAHWVMHCDADEFWWADGMALKRAFGAVSSKYGLVWVKRHEFQPCDLRGQPFWEQMVISDTQPLNTLGRRLLPKCAHRADPDVVVCQGNHDVVSSTLAPAPEPLAATILHFPVRTFEQFERKSSLGGRAYARNRELPPTTGNTWRSLYASYLDGTLRSRYEALVPSGGQLPDPAYSPRYVVDERLREAMLRIGPPRDLPAGSRLPRPRQGKAQPRSIARTPTSAGTRARRITDSQSQTPGDEVLDVILHSPRTGIDGRMEERLIAFLDGAERSLDVASQDIRATGVLAALHDAERRGVRVRLLTGGDGQAATKAKLRAWHLSSTSVRRGEGSAATQSYVVRDAIDVWCGSASFTHEALHEQDSDGLVLRGRRIAAKYEASFEGRHAIPTACPARESGSS